MTVYFHLLSPIKFRKVHNVLLCLKMQFQFSIFLRDPFKPPPSSHTFTAHYLKLKYDMTIWCISPPFAMQFVHTTFALRASHEQRSVWDCVVHAAHGNPTKTRGT